MIGREKIQEGCSLGEIRERDPHLRTKNCKARRPSVLREGS